MLRKRTLDGYVVLWVSNFKSMTFTFIIAYTRFDGIGFHGITHYLWVVDTIFQIGLLGKWKVINQGVVVSSFVLFSCGTID